MSQTKKTIEQQVALLQERIGMLEDVLGTAIAWIAESAASPLSIPDAKELLRRIDECKERE